MVVIGPGLSLCDETQQLVRELVPAIQKPLLIDGDGITAISHDIELLRKRRCQTILTPHLGEMSRLIGKSIDEIQTELVPLLQQFTKDSHSCVVAKGAHSLTGYPDGRISINLSGNSGMATAGSGDVLVGTIAGMFGLGLDIETATRTGVFIHGLSGDLAAKEKGEDGITAQDIMEYLPLSVKYYRENYNELTEQLYHRISIC
jgi:NAD(P)H-hydrate epimerase